MPTSPRPPRTGSALRAGTFHTLRTPNFRRLTAGVVASQTAFWMQVVAINVVVLERSGSGVALGLVTAARFGPLLLLGALTGLLADRLDRRRLLVWIAGAGAAVHTAFALVIGLGPETLWPVYLLCTAAGLVQAAEQPVRRAFLGDVVHAPSISSAVALNGTAMTLCEILGLVAAGVLSGGPGPGWCLAVAAGVAVLQPAFLLRIDRDALPGHAPVVRAAGQIREGLRYAWADPAIRVSLLLILAVGMFGFSVHPVLFPLLAERELGGGPASYTVLSSTVSAGALVAGLAMARSRRVPLRGAAWATVAFAATNGAIGYAPTLATACVLAALAGFAVMVVVLGLNTELQLRAAPHLRGRVLALSVIVFTGSTPVGGPVVGWLAELLGTPAALLACGLVCLAAGTGALVWRGSHGGSTAREPAGAPGITDADPHRPRSGGHVHDMHRRRREPQAPLPHPGGGRASRHCADR